MASFFSNYSRHFLLAVSLLSLLVLVRVAFVAPVVLTNAWDDVRYRVHPTANLAFALGEKHFNARTADLYDIPRARYFYDETVRLNPEYPMVHHELGRIAFLRSDFVGALAELNKEFEVNPNPSPASYYVRALIKGFMGEYAGAALDYHEYFKVTPGNWAAINDYSWILLKAGKHAEALEALNWGLKQWPDNPWLLNNKTTALYELLRYKEALTSAKAASEAVNNVREPDWLNAYPGNDPLSASIGLSSFKAAVSANEARVRSKLTEKGL